MNASSIIRALATHGSSIIITVLFIILLFLWAVAVDCGYANAMLTCTVQYGLRTPIIQEERTIDWLITFQVLQNVVAAIPV